MPIMVEHKVKADTVKVNDFIPGYELTVSQKETKQKYVYLYSVDSDKPLRLAREAVILVGRSEKTAQEKLQEERETLDFYVDNFLKFVDSLADSDPAAELIKTLQENNGDVSFTLRWNCESALFAHWRRAHARQLRGWLESDKRTVTVLEAIIEWREELRDGCVKAALWPAQSTSPVSNLDEQMRAKATAKLLDSSELSWITHALDRIADLEKEVAGE